MGLKRQMVLDATAISAWKVFIKGLGLLNLGENTSDLRNRDLEACSKPTVVTRYDASKIIRKHNIHRLLLVLHFK